MRIKTLSLGLGVDMAGLGRELAQAADRIARVGESVRPVNLGVAAADTSALASNITEAFDQIAARLATAFRPNAATQGMADLARVADRTAGTIITGFRRIDSEISFPKVQQTLKGISDGLVKASAVPLIKGAGAEAAKAAGAAGKALARLWDAGPVARYWADFEARGAAALAKVRAREAMPARTTVGVGRAIELPGSRVSKAEEQLAANFQRAVTAAGRYREALLGVRLAAQVVGTTAKGAFLIATDYPRYAASGALLLTAGYIKLKATIASISLPLTRIRDVAGKGFSAIFGGANQSAAALGRASLSARALGTAVRTVQAPVTSLTGAFKGLGTQVAAALGVFGLAFKAVTFLKDGVTAASDFNEAVGATKAVFTGSFGAIESQAAGIQKAFGVARRSQLDSASAFGAIVQGAGYGEQASAAFANTFNRLTLDLSSFKNIPFEDAATKLRAALAGETEPLRQYGVVITDDAVKMEALRLGLVKSTKDMTNNAKVTARASLITNGLAAANGSAARESEGYAGQTRKLSGNVAALGERIGQAILPAATAAARAFNALFEAGGRSFAGVGGLVNGYFSTIAAGFDYAGMVVRNFSAYWEAARLSATQTVANVIEWFGVLPQNFAIVTDYLGHNWRQLLADMGTATVTAFTNLATNAGRLATAMADALSGRGFNPDFVPLLDGFKATAAQFPGLVRPVLTDLSAEMGAVFDGIYAKEAARAALVKPVQAAAALPAAADATKPAEALAKKPEVKLASAVEVGSKDAYSAVVKAQVGGRDKGLGGVEKNTKKSNDHLAKIERGIDRIASAGAPAVFSLGTA